MVVDFDQLPDPSAHRACSGLLRGWKMLITVKTEMVLSSWQAPPNNTHTALQSTDIPGTTTQRDRWTDALLPTLTLHFSQQTHPEPLHRETGGQRPSYQCSHCSLVIRHTQSHYTDRQMDWQAEALLITLTLHFSHQTDLEPLHRDRWTDRHRQRQARTDIDRQWRDKSAGGLMDRQTHRWTDR